MSEGIDKSVLILLISSANFALHASWSKGEVDVLGAGAGPVAGGDVLVAETNGISIDGELAPTRRAPPGAEVPPVGPGVGGAPGLAPGVGIGADGTVGPPDGLLGAGGAPAGGVPALGVAAVGEPAAEVLGGAPAILNPSLISQNNPITTARLNSTVPSCNVK